MDMRYTEEIKRGYITSEDQNVNYSDRKEYRQACSRSRDVYNGGFSQGGKIITAVIAAALSLFVVFMVVYNFTGQSETMTAVGECMVFIFPYGIACVISSMLLKKKITTFTVYDPARNIFSCVLFALAAIAVIPASLLIKNVSVFFVFGVPGIYMIFAFFFRMTERIRMFKKPVEARCTGYSRRISHGRRTGTNCFISPVWEYEVNGEHIASVYDRYDSKWSSEVELDSTKTIYCRESDPESIVSPNKEWYLFFFLIFGVLLVALCFFNNF